METQKAIALIAEVLDVLVGHYTPDCGGDFKLGSYCKGCEYYHQCRQGTEARELNSKLQSLLADPVYRKEVAYETGFDDALNGRPRNNLYTSEKGYDLANQYARGFFDGAV